MRSFLRGASPDRGRYELVLADPPYEGDWPAELAASGSLAALLASGGVLIIERSVRDPQPETGAGLVFRASRSYGETAFDWFDREESAR